MKIFHCTSCSALTAQGNVKPQLVTELVGDTELFVALSVTHENNFLSLCLYFPYSKMKMKTFIHPASPAGVCKTLGSP